VPQLPDLALRLLLSELAALAPDDLAAVLDALSERERHRVETLLREADANKQSPPPPPVPAPTFEARKFSPWLVERFKGAGAMSASARDVLVAAAVRLHPALPRAAGGLFGSRRSVR